MMRIRRLPLLLALTATAAALMGLALPATAAAAGCKPSAIEAAIAKEINRQRGARGLSRLRLDSQLSTAAVYHTLRIRQAQRLRHTSARTLRRRVTNSSYLAENLGTLEDATAASVGRQAASMVATWMRSRTHRRNILRAKRYRYQGLGVLYRGNDLWVTHLFAGKQNPGTRVSTRVC